METVKTITIFTIFLILLFASVLGVLVPENTPLRSVGPMQIAPFQDGLSLFEGQRGQYYTFSPFNDYVVDTTHGRSALISKQEIDAKAYSSSFLKPQGIRILESVINYIYPLNPSIQFSARRNISYEAKIQGNSVTINRTIQDHKSTITHSGITLSYRDMNYIYDNLGNLYSYKSEEEIAAFKEAYGITLNPEPLGNLRTPIKGSYIILANPYTSSVITVVPTKAQKIYINRDAKIVEIEEQVNSSKQNIISAHLTIYPNPKEVRR